MTRRNRTLHRVRLLGVGAAMAGAAAIICVVSPAAHADDVLLGAGDAVTTTTPADLLSEASANFTAADNFLGEVPTSDVPNLIVAQVNEQTGAIGLLSNLAVTENFISSFDNGEFTNLVTPLFNDFDQNWLQASEAALNADSGLETAISNGTGVTAAELATFAPELHTMGDVFVTESIDQTAYLLSLF